MHPRPEYRRRPDGLLEIVPRRRPVQELLVSAALAGGGLALIVTLATAAGTILGPRQHLRTAGVASACWNWSSGAGGGCWTR